MDEHARTPFQIADGYEPDVGDLVGVNDFSYGHEAGQMFAAERIARDIADADPAGSEAVRLLRAVRWMFDEEGNFNARPGDGADQVLEIDRFLAAFEAK
jgi:hypothetical protein